METFLKNYIFFLEKYKNTSIGNSSTPHPPSVDFLGMQFLIVLPSFLIGILFPKERDNL